jgi:hypothetical protein
MTDLTGTSAEELIAGYNKMIQADALARASFLAYMEEKDKGSNSAIVEAAKGASRVAVQAFNEARNEYYSLLGAHEEGSDMCSTQTTIDYSLDELREMAELTDRIAANLKFIEENGDDLQELDDRTSRIALNLKPIAEAN